MADCKPLHPYNIMLCKVSKYLTGNVEKMHGLGRIMGCRDTRGVECPTLLFLRLEEVGALSEFSVTHLRNALEIMDLPEAAIRVKEYEDYLSGQVSEITPSTAATSDHLQNTQPPYSSKDPIEDNAAERSDLDTSMPPPPYSFTQQEDKDASGVSTVSSSVPSVTESSENPEADETKAGPLSSMDQSPEPKDRTKYHTVNPSTMRRDYPNVKFDFFQKRD